MPASYEEMLAMVFLEAQQAYLAPGDPQESLSRATAVMRAAIVTAFPPNDEPRMVDRRHVALALKRTGHFNVLLMAKELLALRAQVAGTTGVVPPP